MTYYCWLLAVSEPLLLSLISVPFICISIVVSSDFLFHLITFVSIIDLLHKFLSLDMT